MGLEIYQDSRGRFVIAQHVGGDYIASMHPQARRVTGCSQVSARTIDALARDGNVPTYSTRASAVRAMRRSEAS